MESDIRSSIDAQDKLGAWYVAGNLAVREAYGGKASSS